MRNKPFRDILIISVCLYVTDVNLTVLDTNTDIMELSILDSVKFPHISNFYLTFAIHYLLTYSLHLIGICPNISFLPLFENWRGNQEYLLKHLLHKCINI